MTPNACLAGLAAPRPHGLPVYRRAGSLGDNGWVCVLASSAETHSGQGRNVREDRPTLPSSMATGALPPLLPRLLSPPTDTAGRWRWGDKVLLKKPYFGLAGTRPHTLI